MRRAAARVRGCGFHTFERRLYPLQGASTCTERLTLDPPLAWAMLPSAMDPSPICVEGQTCWRRTMATRVAFLVDGDAYFGAFVDAALRARHAIYLLGWDIQGAARLRPGAMPDGLPATLREFLNVLLRRRRTLHAHLLDWDYAFIYA